MIVKKNAKELADFRVEEAFDILKKEYISEETSAELLRKAKVCIRWFWKSLEDKQKELNDERHLNSQYKEKAEALEEICASQTRQISDLEHQSQLAAATEKLKMTDLSSSDIRTEYEEQKRVVSELQDRLRAAENQLLKITELKGKTVLEQKPEFCCRRR